MTETDLSLLSFDQVVDRLVALKPLHHARYLAMYSSWYGGVIVDPALMMVPMDDHLVHRGDGIFEAFKCVNGNIYGLDRHLDRLEFSARVAQLDLPFGRDALAEIIRFTIRASNARDNLIRVYVSRGPGGFTSNPYECVGSQLYVVITALTLPTAEKYERGVTLKTSRIPIKKAYFSSVKSCNYLPNVLMTKEARDAGVDFAVSVDENGFLGEGATENIGIITPEREFLVPRFDRILRGITVSRMMELAQDLVVDGTIARVGEADITPETAYGASEVMMFGTTFDVLPVVDFDGRRIGRGVPGPVFAKFRDVFRKDVESGPGMLTPVWDGR